jgi:hypothetical protein
MKSMERRIKFLEQVTPQASVETRESDVQVEARFNSLLESMDPEHARNLLDELHFCDSWCNSKATHRQSGRRDESNREPRALSHLAQAALSIICAIESGPAALPPQVAQVYIEDPKALPIQDCEDCGYLVPATAPAWSAAGHRPGRSYFERCPLCGGKTGVHARYHKLHAG